MNKLSSIILLPLLWIMMYSCTQFEDVGSGLVDDENLLVGKETSLDLSFETYKRDSLIAYRKEGSSSDYIPTTHILAQLDDPIFGKTAYDLTAQLQFERRGLDFEGAELDSVVFLLSYDTTFVPYGHYDQPQTLEIYELTSRDLPEIIYTTDQFETKPEKLARHTFVPDYKHQNRVDSVSIPPHIRIPLSEEFGNRILGLDTTITSSVLNLLDEFPGIVVRPVEGEFQGGFRFFPHSVGSSSSASRVTEFSGIRIYYTQEDESKEAFLGITNGLHHFTTIRHEYAETPLEETLEENPADPEFLYLQPGGTGIKIRFNDLSQFQGKIINDVEIKWQLAGHPMDDTTAYRPLPSIFAIADDFDTKTPITDILMYQSSGAYRQAFKGLLVDNETGDGSDKQYTFNFTNEFQNMVDGAKEPEIFITVPPQDVSLLNRSVIYGPGIEDSKYRPSISSIDSSTK